MVLITQLTSHPRIGSGQISGCQSVTIDWLLLRCFIQLMRRFRLIASCISLLLSPAAVLSRIATALPDADDGDVTSGNTTAWHSGSSFVPSAGNNSYGGVPTAGDAVMSPAVLLADAIGRSVNSRVKYLRFKHHQREFDHQERSIRRQAREAYKQQPQQPAVVSIGEKLSESLTRYNKHSDLEAAEYQAGQMRLDVFREMKNLRAAERKAAKAAKVN